MAGSSPFDRNREDVIAGETFGIGATNIEERAQAMRKELVQTPVKFECHNSVANGGVLFLLPFLIQSGILTYDSHYEELKPGYYDLNFIVLFISFMYLQRIKNPEQLKYHSPGELGKILGIDRVPESKCLREKLRAIMMQFKSKEWNRNLFQHWLSIESNDFFYIDGHVKVYYGHKSQLGKKHVARQKLCLPGMQEFWVNNMEGLPYCYVTGEVNEKLLEMMSGKIIPKLLNDTSSASIKEKLLNDADLPRFTTVFDREGYSPVYFGKLWTEHRIAVLTYKKNVKDKWSESDFISYKIEIDGTKKTMKLAEKEIKLNGVIMREVRCLKDDGHQCSIITTNKKLTQENIAIFMFSRWTQENFFKYMIQDYAFDRMSQYLVESIDGDFEVCNPEYSNLSYYIKKEREKISRIKAKLMDYNDKSLNENLEHTAKQIQKIAEEKEKLDIIQKKLNELIEQRKTKPCKIKIKEMPEHLKYNKLETESTYFLNIIKMICFRAETAFANHLSNYYKKHIEEKRSLVKSIIFQPCDIKPDYMNKTLTISLYTLSTPRMNTAISEVCKLLNETETVYPGTELVMFYKLQTP